MADEPHCIALLHWSPMPHVVGVKSLNEIKQHIGRAEDGAWVVRVGPVQAPLLAAVESHGAKHPRCLSAAALCRCLLHYAAV